jgi:hypothetical protein
MGYLLAKERPGGMPGRFKEVKKNIRLFKLLLNSMLIHEHEHGMNSADFPSAAG